MLETKRNSKVRSIFSRTMNIESMKFIGSSKRSYHGVKDVGREDFDKKKDHPDKYKSPLSAPSPQSFFPLCHGHFWELVDERKPPRQTERPTKDERSQPSSKEPHGQFNQKKDLLWTPLCCKLCDLCGKSKCCDSSQIYRMFKNTQYY